MEVIKWRQSYCTGITWIDEEHRTLVGLIDRLYHALRDRKDRETIMEVCNEVIAYTEYHFANEEEAIAAYPAREEHRAEHTRMKARVVELQGGLSGDYRQSAEQLYRFLRQWLVSHIQGSDFKYVPYLQPTSAGPGYTE
jgi:hemerythrin